MSDLAVTLQQNFQQYIYPILTGMALGLVVLVGVFLFFSTFWRACRPRRGSLEWISMQRARPLSFSFPCHPMERRDALPILLITGLYALSAFFQLGSLSAPQSALDLSGKDSVEIAFTQPVHLTKLMYFSNLGTGSYQVEISPDGEHWYTLWARKDEDGKNKGYYWANGEGYAPHYALPQKYNDLFKWLEIEPENPQNVSHLRLTGKADKGLLELGELALYGQDGVRLDMSTLLTTSLPLFDEQDTVPEQSSWFNSTYFDEIYHPRTALEHIEGVYPYEVSHPPLGKLIIGLGIRFFGMTPFGWRFMGTLCGVLMVPLLYLWLKNLFGKTVVAACGTILLATDFMHLTQTRIATIDSYGVFFILLMYYFLYRYLALPAGSSFRRGAPLLLLSGLFWGIGAASKWTVIYGGVGLALLYFMGMYFWWRDWPRQEGAPAFSPWLVKTLLFSVLCFVLLPGLIYILSYLPYAQAKGETGLRGLLDIVVQNQIFMFTYHEGVHDTHPYSSRWYQWIVDARPILYYLDNASQASQGRKAAFGCFNNPIVCWSGLLAVLTLLPSTLRRLLAVLTRPLRALFPSKSDVEAGPPTLGPLAPDGRGTFLLVGYLSQLVPWMFIGRTTFAYHYFPSTLFLVLLLAYVMNHLIERRPTAWRLPIYSLTAGCVVLYLLFYPVLIGLMVPKWYTSYVLKWLPSWPF